MIDSGLSVSLARLQAHFDADPRCVAMYLWGSLGSGAADAFSDVDAAIVVHDPHFSAVKAELRGLCESLCGPLLVWLPEGEKAASVNFAFLFNDHDKVLLYDFYVSSLSAAGEGPGENLKVVLFDRAGIFNEPLPGAPIAAISASSLSAEIDNYWTYMYLNGKYYRRRDVYKMLYVQNVLFNTHLRLLQALEGKPRGNWWARDIHELSDAYQNDLRLYFGSSDAEAIARTLWQKMDLFSAHAQAICARSGLEYPAALESGVRRHLHDMGLDEGIKQRA